MVILQKKKKKKKKKKNVYSFMQGSFQYEVWSLSETIQGSLRLSRFNVLLFLVMVAISDDPLLGNLNQL